MLMEKNFLFMKNMLIGDSGASCHVTNNDTGLCDVIFISKLVQGSSGSMPATEKD